VAHHAGVQGWLHGRFVEADKGSLELGLAGAVEEGVRQQANTRGQHRPAARPQVFRARQAGFSVGVEQRQKWKRLAACCPHDGADRAGRLGDATGTDCNSCREVDLLF
jgi:hypothetical protein